MAVSEGRREAFDRNNGLRNTENNLKGTSEAVIKSLKNPRKLPDGIYIKGTAQGYPILYTADTGASKTVLSKRVYDNMRPEDKPPLSKASRLVGAGGYQYKRNW